MFLICQLRRLKRQHEPFQPTGASACSLLGFTPCRPARKRRPRPVPPRTPPPFQKWDRSGKGLLDMKGMLNAAIVKFEMLDKDHKGRLTQQDLAPAVTAQDFTAANPDGDMTIGAKEWFGLVRRHFYAADPDNDGSLSADELKTPAGQALLRLVQ